MRVACGQMCATEDVAANVEAVRRHAVASQRAGVVLLATPENTTFLGATEVKRVIAEPLDGPTHQALGQIAREHGLWLLVGSVAERGPSGKYYNTSLLFDNTGALVAAYRKLHLFDVNIPGGPTFTESEAVEPGDAVIVADSPIGCIGMSVCFDLRFPTLYQQQVRAGATVLSVPSAFTVPTGQAHWHILLRARAIEAQAYVLAPAQVGAHDALGKRVSYGHSVIVDPWGRVLGDAGQDPEGLIIADLDPALVASTRAQMPLRCRVPM